MLGVTFYYEDEAKAQKLLAKISDHEDRLVVLGDKRDSLSGKAKGKVTREITGIQRNIEMLRDAMPHKFIDRKVAAEDVKERIAGMLVELAQVGIDWQERVANVQHPFGFESAIRYAEDVLEAKGKYDLLLDLHREIVDLDDFVDVYNKITEVYNKKRDDFMRFGWQHNSTSQWSNAMKAAMASGFADSGTMWFLNEMEWVMEFIRKENNNGQENKVTV